MEGELTDTEAHAIFCFSPPDKLKIFLPRR